MTRASVTEDKKRVIRLIVSFVVATKHHLRAEGGVHHDDLRGEPGNLTRSDSAVRSATTPTCRFSINSLRRAPPSAFSSADLLALSPSIASFAPSPSAQFDEEFATGMSISPSGLSHACSDSSFQRSPPKPISDSPQQRGIISAIHHLRPTTDSPNSNSVRLQSV